MDVYVIEVTDFKSEVRSDLPGCSGPLNNCRSRSIRPIPRWTVHIVWGQQFPAVRTGHLASDIGLRRRAAVTCDDGDALTAVGHSITRMQNLSAERGKGGAAHRPCASAVVPVQWWCCDVKVLPVSGRSVGRAVNEPL